MVRGKISATVSFTAIALASLAATAACSKKSSTSPAGSATSASPSANATAASPSTSSASGTTETATALSITSAALNQAGGACGPVVIATVDAAGATQALINNHYLSLASTASTGAFYSDSACTNISPAFSLAVGVSGGTFYYTDTAAGSPVITATDTYATPLSSTTQTETISSTAPDSGTAATAAASGSTAASTAATTPAATTPAATTPAATTPAATTPATSPVATAPATPATPGPASMLAFTNKPLIQGVSGCGQITLQIQDASGLSTTAAAQIDMFLTSSSMNGAFYTDSGCATPAVVAAGSNVYFATIAASAGTATFYYKDSTIGGPTVAVTPSSFAAVSQAETIEASLNFNATGTSAVSAPANTNRNIRCTELDVTLPVQASDTALALSSSSATGAFYSDLTNCTSSSNHIATYTAAAGAAPFALFYQGLSTDVVTIAAPASVPVAPVTATVGVPTL